MKTKEQVQLENYTAQDLAGKAQTYEAQILALIYERQGEILLGLKELEANSWTR